jgi:hypothetical protein
LAEIYEAGAAGAGDFSERLLNLSQRLVQDFKKKYGVEADQRLTANEVTELVHQVNIREVRERLSAYLDFKKSVWVLFDNLDKGWSSHGLSKEDILILRSLIDAARKIQRELQEDDRAFHSIVFVRNDVYQLLVAASADYGKESRAVLDWTDGDLLRELVRRRIVYNDLPPGTPFERVWAEICVPLYHGDETSQYFIDRSLMRPRNLLKLIAHCRGFAVNFGRPRIEEPDIEKGLRAYSLDLITEADQELTDILGEDTDLLYHFIGEGEVFNGGKIRHILSGAGVKESKVDDVLEYLLYYGFFGVRSAGGRVISIFDVGYDIKPLKVMIAKAGDTLDFVLNPAFASGLNH